MPTLSPERIAGIVLGLKFDKSEIAVAIALAESGGDPTAVNTANANGSTDYGLWQINFEAHKDDPLFGMTAAHPVGAHGGAMPVTGPLGDDWRDPIKNGEAAFRISDGGKDYNAWTGTYTNGLYQSHMAVATRAVKNPDKDFYALAMVGSGGTPSSFLPDLPHIGNPISDVKDAITSFTDRTLELVTQGALVVGVSLLALLLLTLGAIYLLKSTSIGGNLSKAL